MHGKASRVTGQMRVDLHVHTSPRSPCSSIDPVQLCEKAQDLGLDGICLTEHGLMWSQEEVKELERISGGVRIFRGMEVTTNQGDVLVFGLSKDIRNVIPIEELRKEVLEAGGFMAAAHPFRGFLLFGVTQLQMSVEQASRRSLFQYVDGLEIGNCKVTEPENEMARQVAQKLGLTGVAGSDAHRLEELGKWVTVFQKQIEDESELLQELRLGRFSVEFFG